MRTLTLVFCCLMMLSAFPASAAELKIAVFDLQVVAAKSDAIKQAQEDMKKHYTSKKNQLDKQRQELEKLGAGLNQSSTPAQQQEFRKKQAAYAEEANLYVRNVQDSELKIRQEMDKIIIQAAKELAESKGYDLVLDSAAAIYFKPGLDVTDAMLAGVNAVWKKAGKK